MSGFQRSISMGMHLSSKILKKITMAVTYLRWMLLSGTWRRAKQHRDTGKPGLGRFCRPPEDCLPTYTMINVIVSFHYAKEYHMQVCSQI